MNERTWQGRRVLITGHTGFKGSWLALWLSRMGAQVTGLALPADEVSLFRQARIGELVQHVEGDIRDVATVERAVAAAQPEVVFHMAAQPLVRLSFAEPVETFATNVQGTVHVLDACRRIPGLKAIVCVTSDKCYENREWIWPYRECDPMGGHDPYSASKGAAELVAAAWRRSFFDEPGTALLATARAGNVIGGGDWAQDRLVPDIIRALIAGTEVDIRSPGSVRPWQHVLDALGGYVILAGRLLANFETGERRLAEGWNFGPADSDAQPVGWIVERMLAAWGNDRGGWRLDHGSRVHEARLLRLDCSKARDELAWRPVWPLETSLEKIVAWHQAVEKGEDARAVSHEQLTNFRATYGAALQG
ncbi:MAG: CDP-glucose 4,6-dehydratase [Pseudomonadota bacterium]